MSLSVRTLKEYLGIVGLLNKKGYTLDRLANEQDNVVKMVKLLPCSESRRKMYYSAILWLVRKEFPEVNVDTYTKEVKESLATLKPQETSQQLPEGKPEVKWQDILALKDKVKAKYGETHHLWVLYCLYTMTPPVRIDYVKMEVVSTLDQIARAMVDTENYCVHLADTTSFVFRKYKTSKTYGAVTIRCPDELHQVLKTYLNDRDDKYGTQLLPYASYVSLSQAITNLFSGATGKAKVGATALRHSFITDFLSKPRTIKEKEEVARKMLHSTALQERYCVMP